MAKVSSSNRAFTTTLQTTIQICISSGLIAGIGMVKQYMTGSNGGKSMLDDYGYRYRVLSNATKINRVYWGCILYERKTGIQCKVRIVTQGDTIMKQVGEHNHQPC